MEVILAAFAVAWVGFWLFGAAGRCPKCRGRIRHKDATICKHCGSAIYFEESKV